MSKTVKLLNGKGREQLIEKFYFYDGEAPIVDGVVEIPLDRPEWVQRAYILGYRQDPTSEAVLTLEEALNGGSDSAESAGEDVENSDGGGQPADTDGVRSSEPEGATGVPEAGLGSGGGNVVAEGNEGDSVSSTPTKPAAERPQRNVARNRSVRGKAVRA